LRNQLTDAAIRRAKPQAKPYIMTDGQGLFLIVNPDGSKWWRLKITVAGKRRTMGLGVYPDVELGDARDRRDEARKIVAAGGDPVQARRAPANEEDASFRNLAEKWMAANRSEWKDRTYRIRKKRLERHVFPEIGTKDIRTIDPTEMLRVIRKIEATGVAELPWRMNADCGAIFRFAIASGWKTRDPTADIKDAIKKQPAVTHHAFIRPAEMGHFLAQLHDPELGIDEVTRDALMLTILTVSRTVEVRFARAAEFEGLGGDRPQWRIPASRMKMNREHLVPLSRQAAGIVLRRIALGTDLLFARRTKSGAISENTMLYGLYRAGYHSRATVHGFRRTFSTLANEATTVVAGVEQRMWTADAIERALAHVPSDKVRAAYNAAEYLPERRRMLQWWADWLDRERSIIELIG
jgi:integrase